MALGFPQYRKSHWNPSNSYENHIEIPSNSTKIPVTPILVERPRQAMFSPRKRAQCTPLGLVFDDGFRLLFCCQGVTSRVFQPHLSILGVAGVAVTIKTPKIWFFATFHFYRHEKRWPHRQPLQLLGLMTFGIRHVVGGLALRRGDTAQRQGPWTG